MQKYNHIRSWELCQELLIYLLLLFFSFFFDKWEQYIKRRLIHAQRTRSSQKNYKRIMYKRTETLKTMEWNPRTTYSALQSQSSWSWKNLLWCKKVESGPDKLPTEKDQGTVIICIGSTPILFVSQMGMRIVI